LPVCYWYCCGVITFSVIRGSLKVRGFLNKIAKGFLNEIAKGFVNKIAKGFVNKIAKGFFI